MEPQNKLQKNIGIIMGTVIVVAISLVAVVSDKKDKDVEVESNTNIPIDTTPVKDTTTPVDVVKQTIYLYKDGNYSATGSYMSPGGPDQVGVEITLKKDIVTDITVTPKPGDNTSAKYQAKFMSGYKALVVGKNIADVNLTKVSGSSLTPKGFNDALAKIKAQAKA